MDRSTETFVSEAPIWDVGIGKSAAIAKTCSSKWIANSMEPSAHETRLADLNPRSHSVLLQSDYAVAR
jgi:hypothetical protein